MAKKTEKSGEMEKHKKPMHQNLLQEEFGSELGDYNAHKIVDILQNKENDEKC